MPKATVQAAIGGIVLDTARSIPGISEKDRAVYVEYGNILLSTAVLAIVFTAPIGAILINTLGIKWLSYDGGDSLNPMSRPEGAATLVEDGPPLSSNHQDQEAGAGKDRHPTLKPANTVSSVEMQAAGGRGWKVGAVEG